jgi:hypothetical protein
MVTATKLVQAPNREQESRMYEKHYAPAELGDLWNLSADTVRRMFENEPGVLVFENPERSSHRRFRTLRIPESVAARVYSRFSNARLATGVRIRP